MFTPSCMEYFGPPNSCSVFFIGAALGNVILRYREMVIGKRIFIFRNIDPTMAAEKTKPLGTILTG